MLMEMRICDSSLAGLGATASTPTLPDKSRKLLVPVHSAALTFEPTHVSICSARARQYEDKRVADLPGLEAETNLPAVPEVARNDFSSSLAVEGDYLRGVLLDLRHK